MNVLVLTLASFSLLASAASGASLPRLDLHSLATPTSFSSSTPECQALTIEVVSSAPCNEYQLSVTNIGSVATNGTAIQLVDSLPAGLSIVAVEASLQGPGKIKQLLESDCKVEAAATVRCKFPLHLAPDERLELLVAVEVKSGTSAVNHVTLSGGGVAGSEINESNTFDAASQFGLSAFTSVLTGRAGTVDSNAGDHPYEYTTRLDLNSVIGNTSANTFQASSVEDVRDIVVDLPVGLVGAATATPYCTLVQLASNTQCPADTRVGQLYTEPPSNASANSAIYNIAPEAGIAAEFGFIDELHNVHVIYSTIASTPEGYVLRAITREVPQIPLTDAVVTFFGDPSTRNGSPAAPAMFTNGSNCTGQGQVTNIHMDSWLAPGSYKADGSPNFADPRWVAGSTEAPPLEECEELEGLFQPTIKATPGTTQADSPSGLEVDLNVPQQEEGPDALATPPLRNTIVALPPGITVNPSSANGLEGCSLAQVGISAAGVPNAAAPTCPDGSKIGTVELETPALPSEICKSGPDQPFRNLSECPGEDERQKVPLQGSIYVANQSENPFGSLLAIYIVIDDPRTGIVVKLAGEIKADASTGQLTTAISNSPQFPFTELRTHFFDGPKAPLRTPAVCGPYTLTSQLTPWSAPQSGPPAKPQSTFGISTGAGGGGPCPQSATEEPNSPSFAAASESPTAAAFSPLLVQIARPDGAQEFGQISVTLPPGASGRIAGIPRCSEAQIAQAQARNHLGEGALELASPSCPAASRIGSVTVGAGAGTDPFYVAGNAYLAGPYEGAPFSAVFITPAKAGPFDLGVVVVRAALLIDPTTAQVTTRSDPLPRILQGIPLDIRSLAVKVDRPGFTLTPSNCTPMTVTGTETSTLGQTAPMFARYQVGGCDHLPFKPKLSASAGGKASKANGTSFTVSLSSAGLGQANIAKVQLQLPKALPSRLTTLQKACLAAVFEANPATCPEGSVIGNATIHTPLLDSPLSGPAYLVSHGNAAFPDVEFVLQGEGVELVLDGKTDIKNGITYSRFESAPDAPFTTFQTTLPAGPHSILTANVPQKENYSLCKTSLTMPTTIISQSGVTLKQNTKIALNGCPKTKSKPLTPKQKLANALKSCRKMHNKHKRQVCEGQARKRYGAKKAGVTQRRSKQQK